MEVCSARHRADPPRVRDGPAPPRTLPTAVREFREDVRSVGSLLRPPQETAVAQLPSRVRDCLSAKDASGKRTYWANGVIAGD